MIYLLSPSTQMLRDRIKAGEFGAIITPATGYRPDGLPVWAADNACGPGPNGNACSYRGDEWWAAWLARLAPHAGRCLFAAIPDVVGDAQATLDRFGQLAHVARGLGYPVALVGQNGLENLPVPWRDFEVLFIGGDDAWKLGIEAAGLIREAVRRGKRVHMGRVNGGPRWEYADALGCDTADGKCVNVAPDKNVGRPARWAARPVRGVLL
jgi:hypothetical protein